MWFFILNFLLIISDERKEIENTHNILASQSVVFFYRHHLLMTSHQPIKPTVLNARFSCGQNICKCIFCNFCCCCILSLTISFAEHLIKESSLLLIIYLDYKTNTNNKNNRISVLRWEKREETLFVVGVTNEKLETSQKNVRRRKTKRKIHE